MLSGLFRMTIWNETIPTHLRGRLAGIEMISYMTGPLLGNARAGWMASACVGARSRSSPAASICVAGVLLCIPLLPRVLAVPSRRARPARRSECPVAWALLGDVGQQRGQSEDLES